MLIGSKLPPQHVNRTFFNSGRAAFAFLVEHVVKPRKVYLPAYTCWSLVSTMNRRFPDIEVEFYPVARDLTCRYPEHMGDDEVLVFIHYFGHRNVCPLPVGGTILEDMSHSYMSKINPVGDYVFGSYRKILKVGDGGFIDRYFNPIYQNGQKLDTWLRYEAKDWRDIREAENILDRSWQMMDMSSQSLAVVLTANHSLITNKRVANEMFLAENISVGHHLLTYGPDECPLLHNRLLDTQEERDSLRAFLAAKGIYTSIHWPTHEAVKASGCDIEDAMWLESHIISIPVSHDYGLNDMEYITEAILEWA